jgi:thiol-disulfide isomerase/thioredoxin
MASTNSSMKKQNWNPKHIVIKDTNRIFHLLLFLCCALFLSYCSKTIHHLQVTELESHQKIGIRKYLNQDLNVLVLLGTECPICIKYTRTLTELSKKYPEVAWVGVFNRWEDSSAVGTFIKEYNLPFSVVLDQRHDLIRYLDAQVTPEVFLLNKKAEILYRGAIDNWFFDLGKRRLVITENYLNDALLAAQARKPIAVKSTKPIGCVFAQ